jgi:hypothetical protein
MEFGLQSLLALFLDLLWSSLLSFASLCFPLFLFATLCFRLLLFASICNASLFLLFAFSSLCALKMYSKKEAMDNLENERQWELLRTWRPKEERHPHLNIEPLPDTGLQCCFNRFLNHPFPEFEWSFFKLTLDQDAVHWPYVLLSFGPSQNFPPSQSFLLFPSFNWQLFGSKNLNHLQRRSC